MRSSSTSRSLRAKRPRSARLLAVVAAALLVPATYAMDPARDVSQYVRDEWGSEQGFPGGPVYAIAQTPDGYLWIGAEKGLVRFDGTAFTLLPPTVPGQPAVRTVLGLVADADGSLWVRVAGPTLLRYKRRRRSHRSRPTRRCLTRS